MLNRAFLHEELYRGKNFENLKNKVVTIAGCGAVGSWTATLLARMGIQNFRLIDKDRVDEHNISTQTFTPANVGQHKTRALQEQLYRLCKARCELQPVEAKMNNAPALLSDCDLVICSFDNRAGRLLVKDMYVRKHYLASSLKTLKLKAANDIGFLFAGMNGTENYFEVVWAENYMVPSDPEPIDADPCNYPLSTPLVLSTAAATAEIAMQYLLSGTKKECRQTLNQTIT